MELSDLEKQRYSKMEALRQRGVEPYPTRSEVTMTIGQAVKAFEDAEKMEPQIPFRQRWPAGCVLSA